MEIVWLPIERLMLDEDNPRLMDDEEVAKLGDGIEEFGFLQPIVVNRTDMLVVDGHQRLRALARKGKTGAEEVPVFFVDLDPLKARELNLALNRIDGDWDDDRLKTVLADLEATGVDVTLTGFEEAEIEALAAWDPDNLPGATAPNLPKSEGPKERLLFEVLFETDEEAAEMAGLLGLPDSWRGCEGTLLLEMLSGGAADEN